jgi:predicted nucleic acid-binding protein
VITLDTSAVVAIYDRRDPNHGRVTATLDSLSGSRMIPAELLSEIDHMLRGRMRRGPDAVASLLVDLVNSVYTCQCDSDVRLPRVIELLTRYQNLRLDLADAAVVACAEAHGGRVLSLDRRDFDVIAGEGRITVLP